MSGQPDDARLNIEEPQTDLAKLVEQMEAKRLKGELENGLANVKALQRHNKARLRAVVDYDGRCFCLCGPNDASSSVLAAIRAVAVWILCLTLIAGAFHNATTALDRPKTAQSAVTVVVAQIPAGFQRTREAVPRMTAHMNQLESTMRSPMCDTISGAMTRLHTVTRGLKILHDELRLEISRTQNSVLPTLDQMLPQISEWAALTDIVATSKQPVRRGELVAMCRFADAIGLYLQNARVSGGDTLSEPEDDGGPDAEQEQGVALMAAPKFTVAVAWSNGDAMAVARALERGLVSSQTAHEALLRFTHGVQHM